MNKRGVKLAAGIVLLLAVALCAGYLLSKPMVYAVSRLHVRQDLLYRRTGSAGYPVYLQEISSFLQSTSAKTILRQSQNAEAGSVRLVHVQPVRSTDIVWIEYRGHYRTRVWNTASNAAFLVMTVYATNQPGMSVSYIDTEFWQPNSKWSKFVHRLSGLFE